MRRKAAHGGCGGRATTADLGSSGFFVQSNDSLTGLTLCELTRFAIADYTTICPCKWTEYFSKWVAYPSSKE